MGDNLNPNFPNGDGVQLFLTFDISEVGSFETATLTSIPSFTRGEPYSSLGNLLAQDITYESFGPHLFNKEPGEFSCVFAQNKSGPFECDVSTVVRNAVASDHQYVQFRLRFEEASNSDGAQDLALFYKLDSNTNEPGLFAIEIE